MKKLNKNITAVNNSIQAYACSCTCNMSSSQCDCNAYGGALKYDTLERVTNTANMQNKNANYR